jgi:hypothetical protein
VDALAMAASSLDMDRSGRRCGEMLVAARQGPVLQVGRAGTEQDRCGQAGVAWRDEVVFRQCQARWGRKGWMSHVAARRGLVSPDWAGVV